MKRKNAVHILYLRTLAYFRHSSKMSVKQVIFFNLAYTLKTVPTNFLCSCVFHSLSQANWAWAWTWTLKPEQTSPLPGAYVAELRCLAGWAQGHYFTDKSCFEESWMWGTASPFHWELLSRRGFAGSPSLCIFTDGQQWSVCSVSLVTPSILPLIHTRGMGLLASCHCGVVRRPLSHSDHSSQVQSWC